MRITAGANLTLGEKLEEGMEDRRSCITPAYMNGLETIALTEKQEKVQVCETMQVRRIVGVKRAGKSRTDDLESGDCWSEGKC